MKNWRESASCVGVDTEMFFTEGELPATELSAMCYDCPVKWECRLAGYPEDYGIWGNTSGAHRGRSRRSIFGRLYGNLLLSDDGAASLRKPLEDLADRPGDVLDNMRDAGFTDTEIAIFTGITANDSQALRRIARQELVTTLTED